MPRYMDHMWPGGDEAEWEQIVYLYDPMEQMMQSLEKLVTGYPPKRQYDRHECKGLYSGPTSVAYLFLQLSRSHPDLEIKGSLPKQWAMLYLEGERSFSAVTKEHNGVISESLAYPALRAAAGEEGFNGLPAFYDAVKIVALSKGGPDEWLYGRAGCLYLLRLIRHWTPPEIGQQVEPLIAQMIHNILEQGSSWPFHGKDYLGAVHGRMGIITQIILCDPSKASHPNVLKSLGEVLDSQNSNNNWPASMNGYHDDLVQFCHGAPGIVISLKAIAEHFDEDLGSDMWEACEMAVLWIVERGLLTKEPNLCHGTTGNALGVFHRERKFLMEYIPNDAIEQGLRNGTYTPSDDPYGLFCGEAGRAWGWLNVLSGEDDERGMIGYNDV